MRTAGHDKFWHTEHLLKSVHTSSFGYSNIINNDETTYKVWSLNNKTKFKQNCYMCMLSPSKYMLHIFSLFHRNSTTCHKNTSINCAPTHSIHFFVVIQYNTGISNISSYAQNVLHTYIHTYVHSFHQSSLCKYLLLDMEHVKLNNTIEQYN